MVKVLYAIHNFYFTMLESKSKMAHIKKQCLFGTMASRCKTIRHVVLWITVPKKVRETPRYTEYSTWNKFCETAFIYLFFRIVTDDIHLWTLRVVSQVGFSGAQTSDRLRGGTPHVHNSACSFLEALDVQEEEEDSHEPACAMQRNRGRGWEEQLSEASTPPFLMAGSASAFSQLSEHTEIYVVV